ncbi:helix-turn-helix domain-containing protein [Streptomyces sp. 35G-GA-8]|uniref:helix-turn-helix domain-containing protein n=1 Tax=Streptomyces sp. 35G-GA-8 TaxID=2939434 RepID=UPI00201F1276|nr:helix-turn-helix transcriptional regulator [Streptomyces sp. 35G-GA-8]MCL7375552.1 helix-turn-helix transcriptional regulator [Streptomyces sp. 35G-GA-8]
MAARGTTAQVTAGFKAVRAAEPAVGPLLRDWRKRRRVSQLELAIRADSSARHISFIETGRARPSEEMVLRLADRLDVPVRERNTLLLAAGYAPRFTETALDDPAMDAVRQGLERLLQGYEPYPAVVVDGTYTVVAANRGIAMLMEGLPAKLLAPPLNAMRLTLHPEGLAPRIRNLPEWRGHLLDQMERQLALDRSPALRAVYDEVAAYPLPRSAAEEGTTAAGEAGALRSVAGPSFALPMIIEHDGRVLSFLSSISTFNTPMDVTVAELAIETFLPADPATVAYLTSRAR